MVSLGDALDPAGRIFSNCIVDSTCVQHEALTHTLISFYQASAGYVREGFLGILELNWCPGRELLSRNTTYIHVSTSEAGVQGITLDYVSGCFSNPRRRQVGNALLGHINCQSKVRLVNQHIWL